jgi:hypothetical protein
MLALIQTSSGYRILGFLHIISAMAAFGPLFLYTPLKKAGETTVIAKLHVRLVMPALVLMWVFGMGLAGVGGSKMPSPWLSASIVIWLIAVAVNWFLVRPALSDESPSTTSKLAAGIGVTHLTLVVGLFLMIWKPGA